MGKINFTYDPLFISRHLMTRYVEEFIEGKFYKAKQFACYEFLNLMTDEELEDILMEYTKINNVNVITFNDWKSEIELIWKVVFNLYKYKKLEFNFKILGFGKTGMGVVDLSTQTFYDCVYLGHWKEMI